ncbi:MAG: Rrf2 family transcriptional regulator [Deltaproteobacteria bacterium]|nr:Rrf2 family transcriptional regulator [Deltaproteobacteria bacterium]
MSQLASADSNDALPAAALSKQADVPQHYLSKIMRKLVAAKLASATKGPGGGFRIARPPSTIRFLDIMAAVGEEPVPDHCAFGWGRCDFRAPCPMHPAFTKLNEEVWRWATSTTLGEVRSTGALRRRRRARR